MVQFGHLVVYLLVRHKRTELKPQCFLLSLDAADSRFELRQIVDERISDGRLSVARPAARRISTQFVRCMAARAVGTSTIATDLTDTYIREQPRIRRVDLSYA